MVRQTIIDFIIGSRIRDSGAELGPNAVDLGLLIQARVPLHMHQQLDDVFDPWFYFWKEEHWIAAQRRKIGVASMTNNNTTRSRRVTVAVMNSHSMS